MELTLLVSNVLSVVKLKPGIDERIKRLEFLRNKAKMQEADHSLQEPVEQLRKMQSEFRLMERSLRKRCDKLEAQYKKELELFTRLEENTKQKRELLKSSIHQINGSSKREYGTLPKGNNTKADNQYPKSFHY